MLDNRIIIGWRLQAHPEKTKRTGPVARGRGWDVLFDSLNRWRKPLFRRKKEGKEIFLTVLPKRFITVSLFKYFLTFINDEMAFWDMLS